MNKNKFLKILNNIFGLYVASTFIAFFVLLFSMRYFERQGIAGKVGLILVFFVCSWFILAIVWQLFFRKITEKEREEKQRKPEYVSKVIIFYKLLPSVIAILVFCAGVSTLGKNPTNLLISFIFGLIVFFMGKKALQILFSFREDFLKAASLLGLAVKGEIMPFQPKPIYAEGIYNGAKVRILLGTLYRAYRHGTNVYPMIVIQVEHKNRDLEFLIEKRKKTETVIHHGLESLSIKSNNEELTREIISSNVSMIELLLEDTDGVCLNMVLPSYFDMDKNSFFEEAGELSAFLKENIRGKGEELPLYSRVSKVLGALLELSGNIINRK